VLNFSSNTQDVTLILHTGYPTSKHKAGQFNLAQKLEIAELNPEQLYCTLSAEESPEPRSFAAIMKPMGVAGCRACVNPEGSGRDTCCGGYCLLRCHPLGGKLISA
jgi:hypothetical protein